MKLYVQNLIYRLQGLRQFGRSTRTWEYNIKTELEVVRYEMEWFSSGS